MLDATAPRLDSTARDREVQAWLRASPDKKRLDRKLGEPETPGSPWDAPYVAGSNAVASIVLPDWV
jgi:hypothetical protein